MTGHPDHRTISAWTTAASSQPRPEARLRYATLFPSFHDEWGDVNAAVRIFSEESIPLTLAEALAGASPSAVPCEPVQRGLDRADPHSRSRAETPGRRHRQRHQSHGSTNVPERAAASGLAGVSTRSTSGPLTHP